MPNQSIRRRSATMPSAAHINTSADGSGTPADSAKSVIIASALSEDGSPVVRLVNLIIYQAIKDRN